MRCCTLACWMHALLPLLPTRMLQQQAMAFIDAWHAAAHMHHMGQGARSLGTHQVHSSISSQITELQANSVATQHRQQQGNLDGLIPNSHMNGVMF